MRLCWWTKVKKWCGSSWSQDTSSFLRLTTRKSSELPVEPTSRKLPKFEETVSVKVSGSLHPSFSTRRRESWGLLVRDRRSVLCQSGVVLRPVVSMSWRWCRASVACRRWQMLLQVFRAWEKHRARRWLCSQVPKKMRKSVGDASTLKPSCRRFSRVCRKPSKAEVVKREHKNVGSRISSHNICPTRLHRCAVCDKWLHTGPSRLLPCWMAADYSSQNEKIANYGDLVRVLRSTWIATKMEHYQERRASRTRRDNLAACLPQERFEWCKVENPNSSLCLLSWNVGSMARHSKEIFELLIKESPHVLFCRRPAPHRMSSGR